MSDQLEAECDRLRGELAKLMKERQELEVSLSTMLYRLALTKERLDAT